MSALQKLLFFGIPHDTIHSKELRARVNLERSKIYFSNTKGSLNALFLGLFLAIVLLSFFNVPIPYIVVWAIALSSLGFVVYFYETAIIRAGFYQEKLAYQVLMRLMIGFCIALVWGFFAQLMPKESMLGYTLSYIAMSTFINIGMLSYSMVPLQYLVYFVGALIPLEIKLGINFLTLHDPFYLILAAVFFICEIVLLRKALINSKTSIQAIILNEKLKDEISLHTKAQTHIEFLAYHDHLTGVWNRRYIESFLNELVHMTSLRQHRFGIMLIDINYFKPINDTYGHNFGDELLTRFTHHLQNELPHNALLGRFGGDEFIIIFEKIASYQELEAYGIELKKALYQTYTINDITVDSSASVGWAIFPEEANDIETLINIADERMYEDKRLDHQRAVNF